MNKEGFIDTLRIHYSDEIKEAHLESTHKDIVDYVALNEKLHNLMDNAKVEGLPLAEFEELVKTLLPDTSVENIHIFLK